MIFFCISDTVYIVLLCYVTSNVLSVFADFEMISNCMNLLYVISTMLFVCRTLIRFALQMNSSVMDGVRLDVIIYVKHYN